MRIAVIGSGVSGLLSAWLLSRTHGVTIFESEGRLGGHVHTHQVALRERSYNVDTGFIVHNPVNYPLLTRLFAELGVISQPTTMSFAVRNETSGLEYGTSTLAQLLCQPRNLLSPLFLGMMRDVMRFYRHAGELLKSSNAGPTLGEYLQQEGFGTAFRDNHLVPMACALWSAPAAKILDFPARYLVQFMANHQMLQVRGRPQWQVVTGGSYEYVKALRQRWKVAERLSSPVRSVRRTSDYVEISTDAARERFDHVILACHSDQALALLADASEREIAILGAMPYQKNDAVLHTDSRMLPRNRRAWSSWNALISANTAAPCAVSYYMNLLQAINSPDPIIVTLNRSSEIDPTKVLRQMQYEHPVYSPASVAARGRKSEIQGQRRTWFAGAYWGWGFHEDGARSAVEVAAALGIRWGRFNDAPDPTGLASLPLQEAW